MSVSCTVDVELALGGGAFDPVAFDDLAFDTATLESVIDDVRAQNGMHIEYGIPDGKPTSRVASSGEAKFWLNNANTNVGGIQGWYSPNNANVRSGFTQNILGRVMFGYSGVVYYKFVGRLKDITPSAGQYQPPLDTACVLTDYFDDFARANITGLGTGVNRRGDQLLTTLLTKMMFQPSSTSFDAGVDTFPFGFVGALAASVNALQEAQRITLSEMGYLYMKGDTSAGGVLRWENRHTRPANVTNKVVISNAMNALSVPSNVDDILNNIQVTVHDRNASGSPVVLYSSTSQPSIGPLGSIVVTGAYRDPTQQAARIAGTAFIGLVSGTDYVANSAADGSGTNLTANLTVSVVADGSAATFTITNNSMTTSCYLTTLQIRGTALYDYDSPTLINRNSASEAIYGSQVLPIDMVYQSDVGVGGGVASWIDAIWGTPFPYAKQVSFLANVSDANMLAALTVEVGDRIGIVETQTGVSTVISGQTITRGYFVQRVILDVAEGPILTVTWMLAPADVLPYWILEQAGSSELDNTTRLGYV